MAKPLSLTGRSALGQAPPKTLDVHLFTVPTVIKNVTSSWPCSCWDTEELSNLLGNATIRFRIGRKNIIGSDVEFEGDCIYEEATMKNFHEWCQQKPTQDDLSEMCFPPSSEAHTVSGREHDECRQRRDDPSANSETINPLMLYDSDSFWCYADYKRMPHMFNGCPRVLEDVRWKDLGFPDHDGHQSTIWIGSEGANTPCHQDTYGFNLVAQITGRKRWHLFPPSQTELMYPTRIPYEESSVFSRVNIKSPDLRHHPKFGKATPYVVDLHPGDVLFVPKLWWHFVESLDTSISINCWMDLASDHVSRVDEAITRALMCGLMSLDGHKNNEDDENTQENILSWLNPTQEATSTSTNMAVLGAAVDAALTQYSEAAIFNVSEPMPVTNMKLDGRNSPERRSPTSKTNHTFREETQRTVDLDNEHRSGSCVNTDSISTEESPHHQQTSRTYCPSCPLTSPIMAEPIHVSIPVQGDLTLGDHTAFNPDPACVVGKGMHSEERKRGCEDSTDQHGQSNSIKRIKLCDYVTIPDSDKVFAKEHVSFVPCQGSITELNASAGDNNAANLKIEQETDMPAGYAPETVNSFVDVSMATLVECLTQPNIIALIRQELLEKLWGKRRATKH